MVSVKKRKKMDNELEKANQVVLKWKDKFHFSFATLLFSVFLVSFYLINQFFGFLPIVVLSFVVLVFIQQTIRSYNYFKFHSVSYMALKMLHKKYEDRM